MGQIVFRSNFNRYRVYFPPNIFGYMETEEHERDRLGNLIIDPETRQPRKRMVGHPAAQFESGMIALDEDDPMQAQMIANLRKTIERGRADGSSTERHLYEESQSISNLVNLEAGAIMVSVPNVLDAEDEALLFGAEKTGPGLMTFFHNPIPENALNTAFSLLDKALARYQVVGIVSPTKERAKKQLKGRIHDLIYALVDAGMPLDTENRPSKGERPAPLVAPNPETEQQAAS
jgi:hypothetical protein